jgi:hypothetical protein
MSVLQRGWRAMSSGWKAALNAWRGDTVDSITTRAARYEVLWGFYLNDIYDEAVNDLAAVYKRQEKLYSEIVGLYNPVSRLVDFYVSKVAGGNLLPELATAGTPVRRPMGAFPLVCEDEAIEEVIHRVWGWSDWQMKKSLWVRYAASLGDCVLQVTTPPGQVRIEVHHPREVVEADFERDGSISYAVMEYAATERDAEKGTVERYIFRQVFTPEWMRTYRDGEPWDYVNGKAKGPQWEWGNRFGFVPLVLTKHREIGQSWGACCFHHVIDKVDDVNDLASHLGTQIRKYVHPQWVSYGTKAGAGMERKDTLWHHPNPQGKVEALVEEIDIGAVTAEIQQRLTEIEKDCPELKAGHVGDNARDVSGRAVALLAGDVTDRVTEARAQYDAALVKAQEMALAMGAQERLWAPGNWAHRIGERPIFPPDEVEILTLETQRLAVEAQKLALEQQRSLGAGW